MACKRTKAYQVSYLDSFGAIKLVWQHGTSETNVRDNFKLGKIKGIYRTHLSTFLKSQNNDTKITID